MEETITQHELTIGGIIGKGISIGVKNALSLIGATILWILTIWIPYLNVGTTIGLIASVVAMSKGGTMSPVEIFDGKYRRYMGEFFILMGLKQMATFMGIIFLIIPGIVISIAWGQAVYLLVDKRMDPMTALKTSNDITYGKKWTIFFGMLLLALAYQVMLLLVVLLCTRVSDGLTVAVAVILGLLFVPVLLGAMAHIYGTLSAKLER